MTRKWPPLALVGALLVVTVAHADFFDTWFAASPNKFLFAVERRLPDVNEPERLDPDGFAVFVLGAEPGPAGVMTPSSVIAQHQFQRRLVSQIRWSPDSKFLLFTTASSGGHSPWHFKTFVFCSADKSFRDVEDATGGSIGAADFQFESPDLVVLKLYNVADGSLKEIRLALGYAVQRMKRVD